MGENTVVHGAGRRPVCRFPIGSQAVPCAIVSADGRVTLMTCFGCWRKPVGISVRKR